MFYAIFFLCLFFLGFLIFRTWSFKNQKNRENNKSKEQVNRERAVRSLSRAISFKTISGQNPKEFKGFIDFLEENYPLVHGDLGREIINGFSLLYHWRGKDPSAKPALLMAHSDVVPVEGDTEKDWTYPPFEGARAEGFVWGRGSLDDKNNIVAQLEAVEDLLASSFKPSRDIYLAFGHDEEIREKDGAFSIAQLLQERGVELYLVLDEGGGVMEGFIEGPSTPVALVGTAEKGFVNLKLTAKTEGGHSASPPLKTGLGRLAKVIINLEKKQMPARITRPVGEMLKKIGPEMPFGKRFLIANLWLFQPFFVRAFSASPGGNALLRSTVAPTMAEGSKAANVLPDRPSVTINFRLLPGDSAEKLVHHVEKAIGSEDIELDILKSHEPSLVSDGEGEEFQYLQRKIRETFPEAIVAPYLVFGGTDSRYFENVCSQIFRFSPMRIDNSELKRVHARDERISEENIERGVAFYKGFLREI